MLSFKQYSSGHAKNSKNVQGTRGLAKAHEFVLAIYHLTAKFPTAEIYCLTTQARRAAISIAANIPEGFKKRGLKDKTKFFNIAQGSLEESRYYLILAQDLGYADTRNLEIFLEEVSKLLSAYLLAVGTNKRGMRPSAF